MNSAVTYSFKCAALLLAGLMSMLGNAATHVDVDEGTRQHLGMSVYNSNFAVITDTRRVTLPKGTVEIEVTGLASTISPSSVTITSSESRGLDVHQQDYRYDLLNPQILLDRFVGRKVKYSRTILEEGSFESFLREGILLSVNPEIVQFGDVIEVEPVGTISLPYIPDDLKTEPTLVLHGENRRSGAQDVKVLYHADGIGWETEYSLKLDKDAELSAWVTLRNGSGLNLSIDELQLIAGEVNRATVEHKMRGLAQMSMAEDESGPSRSTVGDYHAYQYEEQVEIGKNTSTRLSLMEASGVKVQKTYRMSNPVGLYAGGGRQDVSPSIVIGFENSKSNDLGKPMPAGVLRVYERHGKRETFLGESRVNHVPAGEKIEAVIGKSFDLTGRRTQTAYRKLSERSAEVSYNIELVNAGKAAAEVRVDESLRGDWQIESSTLSGEKVDAETYRTFVQVPASGSAEFTYTARVKW